LKSENVALVGQTKQKINKKGRTMKTKWLCMCILLTVAGGLALVSGCVMEPNGQLALAPIVVAPAPVYVAPPPVVEAQVMVPDTYVWDGYENVGIVDGQYFYLGPGDVWLAAEPWRIDRFHGWERGHPDWREHAIRNDRFRKDAHGHVAPMHGGPEKGKAKAAPKKKNDQH
jgi:hypothetical protein